MLKFYFFIVIFSLAYANEGLALKVNNGQPVNILVCAQPEYSVYSDNLTVSSNIQLNGNGLFRMFMQTCLQKLYVVAEIR